MTTLQRRELLVLIAALGISTAIPAQAHALPGVDQDGAVRIGDAYLLEHKGIDQRSLQRDLLPDGWTAQILATLKQRVSADFRDGKMFIYRGWRLSDTEGRLFALAALTHR